jgi:hypothetical protein
MKIWLCFTFLNLFRRGFKAKKNRFFFVKCQRFAFLVSKTICFFTLMPKYVSFRSDFVNFLAIFE